MDTLFSAMTTRPEGQDSGPVKGPAPAVKPIALHMAQQQGARVIHRGTRQTARGLVHAAGNVDKPPPCGRLLLLPEQPRQLW